MTLFDEEFERETITRIRKFAKIADSDEIVGYLESLGYFKEKE